MSSYLNRHFRVLSPINDCFDFDPFHYFSIPTDCLFVNGLGRSEYYEYRIMLWSCRTLPVNCFSSQKLKLGIEGEDHHNFYRPYAFQFPIPGCVYIEEVMWRYIYQARFSDAGRNSSEACGPLFVEAEDIELEIFFIYKYLFFCQCYTAEYNYAFY